jgi:UDP-N-acetylglucosamine diphosphorylase/glucosamine-1-phosphate N-acetyltransferase
MTPRLYLYDDARAREWVPFARTRPVGELLHGVLLQRERWSRIWKVPCAGHLTGPELAGFTEPQAPAVVERTEADTEGIRIVVSSRAVPDTLETLEASEPATLEMNGEVVGWIVGDGDPLPSPDALAEGRPGPDATREIPGRVLEAPWTLIHRNEERIARDIRALRSHGDSFLLTDVHTVGEGLVSLGPGAVVEPGVILDVRDGPIRLEEGVRVQGPARLTGPLWVGAGSTVLGGAVGTSSVGPVSKVRGEVEASVLLGYVNKAHDGYLGHALLGRWVNLGALTTNSDLKNSYSPVRVRTAPGEDRETGLLKVGAFLGDHVKTGIGTLLTTGAVVGAGSNVFGGGGALPRYVPPFSWGTAERMDVYRIDKFLEVAEAAMARRGVELDPEGRELLRRVWDETRALRSGGR